MSTLHLFEAFGIEMEYMIVDRKQLNVQSIADRLFDGAGGEEGELDHGEIAWSNELALHVVEFKTNGPWRDLTALPTLFAREVVFANQILAKEDAMLLPSGAHPWMDPNTEAHLWPHEYNEIYESYNRIFNCRGHGWVNLQSTHLNLPFANDAEFLKLHAAIRCLLPIMPALTASTPFLDGKPSGWLDTRLSFYGGNQRKIPAISGSIIPEDVDSQQSYQDKILTPMFRAIASEDPAGLLQHEWLNSRAAIARFQRMAIEIRILDIQEAPVMDIAMISLIVEVLKALVAERWTALSVQRSWHERDLLGLYQQVIREGRHVRVDDSRYLALFGLNAATMSVNDLWQHLMETVLPTTHWARPYLQIIFSQGCLAERMLARYQQAPSPAQLTLVYRELAECLAAGQAYLP